MSQQEIPLVTPIPEIVVKQCKLIEAMLSKLPGARFKIVLPDGQEFGTLVEAAPPKPPKTTSPKRNLTMPYGTIAKVFSGYLMPMTSGDVASIPIDVGTTVGITPQRLRDNVQAWCCGHWGKGNYTVDFNAAGTMIEVLRH